MKAKAVIGGYSWIGLLNLLFLQWLFIRLMVTVDNMRDRNIIKWRLIGFIWPTTGWDKRSYKYLWRFNGP